MVKVTNLYFLSHSVTNSIVSSVHGLSHPVSPIPLPLRWPRHHDFGPDLKSISDSSIFSLNSVSRDSLAHDIRRISPASELLMVTKKRDPRIGKPFILKLRNMGLCVKFYEF